MHLREVAGKVRYVLPPPLVPGERRPTAGDGEQRHHDHDGNQDGSGHEHSRPGRARDVHLTSRGPALGYNDYALPLWVG